jgi:outer membrane protein, heavy metal efflux system
MTGCVRKFVAVSLAVGAMTMTSIDLRAQVNDAAHQHGASARVEGPTVTLQSLLREALEKNPELAALHDQIAVARRRPDQERGLPPPMAEAQIWQWPINTLNPAGTNMYMFMVGQDLPGRGKRDAHAAVAEKDIDLAGADVTIRARQIVNEIKQAYSALFIARKATEVHLASVDVLREIADAAQAKYASGRGSQQDLLKPVVELSKLHSDVIMHDQEAGLAVARLNVLLNRDPETPIGPLEEPREETLLPESAALQKLAVEHQPELQRARIEIARAEAELASAKLERKPDFNVQGGYQLMPNQTDGVLATFGVTWPNAPWSRGRIDAKIAERSAAVTAAASRERAMENMVRLAVQEAYVRAGAAQQRASLLRTTILPQARQAFHVSRAAYQSDRADFSSILDSERVFLDSRLDYFRALADFTQAMADLERAVGTELPADTTKLVPASEGQ